MSDKQYPIIYDQSGNYFDRNKSEQIWDHVVSSGITQRIEMTLWKSSKGKFYLVRHTYSELATPDEAIAADILTINENILTELMEHDAPFELVKQFADRAGKPLKEF